MVILPCFPLFFEPTYLFNCFIMIFLFGLFFKLLWGNR